MIQVLMCINYEIYSCTHFYFIVHISDELFEAIRMAASGGQCDPLNAVGGGGTLRGPYQISEAYYNDAVEFDPSLRDGGKSYENVYGPGSEGYSRKVMQAYMNRYATEARLGRPATDEDIARIHGGGTDGFREASTQQYWERVQSYLNNDGNGSGKECGSGGERGK